MASERRLPDWLSFDKSLPLTERVERSMKWLREGAKRQQEEPRNAARELLARQSEHLRDAVEAARQAGLGWDAIASALGISRRQVKRAFGT